MRSGCPARRPRQGLSGGGGEEYALTSQGLRVCCAVDCRPRKGPPPSRCRRRRRRGRHRPGCCESLARLARSCSAGLMSTEARPRVRVPKLHCPNLSALTGSTHAALFRWPTDGCVCGTVARLSGAATRGSRTSSGTVRSRRCGFLRRLPRRFARPGGPGPEAGGPFYVRPARHGHGHGPRVD